MPFELLKICNLIELKLGRVRLKKNSPRTCDIDIIDYNNRILNEKNSKLIYIFQNGRKFNY